MTQQQTLYYNNLSIKRLLILGLGISGQSTLDYLSKTYHCEIMVYDKKNHINLQNDIKLINSFEHLLNIDLVISSPGFDLREDKYQPIKDLNCPIICDIELFYALVKPLNKRIIAITGSNGKSTVTTLIHKLLNDIGIPAELGGNVGIAVFDLIEKNCDVFVLELSSFQLDLMHSFKANIGIITNISKDHLDRYNSYKDYQKAKLKLVDFSEHLICNSSIKSLINHSNCHYFSLSSIDNEIPFNITMKDNHNHIALNKNLIMTTDNIILKGRHNWLNILASLMAIYIYLKITSNHIKKEQLILSIKQTLAAFQSLPSRCNIISIKNNITWIDDSKSTNIGSTLAAIHGFSSDLVADKNCVLILGGLSKDGEFNTLQSQLDKIVKSVFIFGRDRFVIAKQIEHANIHISETLDKVIAKIKQIARPNDIILFSPACASFDQFDNYLVRGQYFKELVERVNFKNQME